MSKLKTAKDLEIIGFEFRKEGKFKHLGTDKYEHENLSSKEFKEAEKNELVRFKDLRQEAIKWLKEEIRIWDSKHSFSGKGKTSDVPTIKRWMERFNITEEDLK